MTEQQKQRDRALLSAAAYTNFFDKNGHVRDENNIKDSLIDDNWKRIAVFQQL